MKNTIDFLVIILSALIAIVIFYSVLKQWEYGNKGIKYTLMCIFIACSIAVSFHACKQSMLHAKIAEYKKAFEDNETLVCIYNDSELHVHRTTFIYLPDLFSFVGKNNLKNINIPITNCNQHAITHDSEIIND